MSRTPIQGLDYTNKDYEGFRNLMIQNLGVKMPEYTDRSQTDAGIVILELLAQGLDILSYYQDGIANETLLSTAQLRDSVLKWCPILDYVPKFATPSKIKQVFVLSSVSNSDTTIPKGTIVKTKGSSAEDTLYFETDSDLIIPAGKKGDEMSDGSYLYFVTATQGLTVYDEILGSSNGTADQSFSLKYSPVIVDSIKVYVNEGDGPVEWSRVDNFVDSSPSSKHFRVSVNDNDEVSIIFGDGNFGKIPYTYNNGVYCTYRTGGGTVGNVGANKVTLTDSSLSFIESTFNPEVPIEYGVDKESLESIRMNAPVSSRTKWGALTYSDFADITKMNIDGVKYAISTGEGYDVTIYVILNNYSMLTTEMRNKILSLFSEDGEGRKIVSAGEITVSDPIKEELSLKADLVVKSTYIKSEVEKNVKDYITNFFAYGNYPFDTPLSFSSLSASVMGIDGVMSFKFTELSEDVMTPEVGKIYTLKDITVTSSGGVSDA